MLPSVLEVLLIHLAFDAFCWRRLCNSFRSVSDDLCSRLSLVRWLLLIPVEFLLWWPVTDCFGICPIGEGEVVWKIIGKAVSTTFKMEILEAAGPLQL